MSRCARPWRNTEPTGRSVPASTPPSPASATSTCQVSGPGDGDASPAPLPRFLQISVPALQARVRQSQPRTVNSTGEQRKERQWWGQLLETLAQGRAEAREHLHLDHKGPDIELDSVQRRSGLFTRDILKCFIFWVHTQLTSFYLNDIHSL